MAQWISTHLLFCEGPHDAAFLNRLLKKKLNFSPVRLKFSELPYPIGDVLQQSFKTRTLDDLRLDLAKKFFLPDFTLNKGEVLVLIFNYGGANRSISIPPLLDKLFSLINQPAFARDNLPRYSYAVFADADADGRQQALKRISTDLATIGESPWLSNQWLDSNKSKACTQSTQYGNTAAYIWKKWDIDNGTLEDVVLECVDQNQGISTTLEFLQSRFEWGPDNSEIPAEACARDAKRLKAALCIEGQHKKPGMSLSVVLDQSDLLTVDTLGSSVSVRDCISFLQDWVQ